MKDDDLLDPCIETLNPAEKEIAHILGPQTFTGIPGGHDSMGHLVRIILVSIFSERKIAFRPRKYPYILGKVSENPKGMDI